jgi:hypothetical protein
VILRFMKRLVGQGEGGACAGASIFYASAHARTRAAHAQRTGARRRLVAAPWPNSLGPALERARVGLQDSHHQPISSPPHTHTHPIPPHPANPGPGLPECRVGHMQAGRACAMQGTSSCRLLGGGGGGLPQETGDSHRKTSGAGPGATGRGPAARAGQLLVWISCRVSDPLPWGGYSARRGDRGGGGRAQARGPGRVPAARRAGAGAAAARSDLAAGWRERRGKWRLIDNAICIYGARSATDHFCAFSISHTAVLDC